MAFEENEPVRRVEVYPGKVAIIEFDPDRRFTCVDSCTWCCHHGVLLYDVDHERLAECASLAASTETLRGRQFVRKDEKNRSDHVDASGEACFFLDADGLCQLQKETGWKPTRCWVYPLAVRPVEDEIAISIRDSAETKCEGMDVGDERIIDHLDAFLPPILWELSNPSSDIAL